jgi:hypothetical protein
VSPSRLAGGAPVEGLARRASFRMDAKDRRDLICWGVILLVWLAIWTPRPRGPVNFRWDASTYYVLGTALAEGRGYRLLNEPVEIHAIQYPPLLPMVVAAHQLIMGTNDYFKVGSALRLTYFLLSGIFLLMTYSFARRLFAPQYALLIAVITALSFSSLLGPSEVLYAEMPFAVIAMGFLLCQQRSDRAIFAAATGVLAAAAYLLRTAGLALLVAWVGESLIRRRFREAAVRAALSLLPILLWQGYVWRVSRSYEYHHPAYSYQRASYSYANVSYTENSQLVDPFRPELGRVEFRDLLGRFARNIATVPVGLGESAIVPKWFAPSVCTQLHKILHVPVSGMWRNLISGTLYCGLFAAGLLALAGAVLIARGPHRFLSLYFGITIATVVLTPWQNQFWRYLAPVVPLTLVFLFLAVAAIRYWLERRYVEWGRTLGTLATTTPAAAILLVQSAIVAHVFRSMGPVSYYDASGRERVYKLIDYPSEWHALDPAFEWIRRNAATTAVIATTVPHLAYLRTGHKTVLPPFERDPDTASRLLDQVPVSYLVLDRFGQPGISERYAAPIVARRPQDWQLVFTAPDLETRVYARTR